MFARIIPLLCGITIARITEGTRDLIIGCLALFAALVAGMLIAGDGELDL